MKDQAVSVTVVAHGGGCLEQADRWFGLVEVELRIAFVCGNEEVVLFGQPDEPLQCLLRNDRPGRVSRGAEIEDLAALPGIRTYCLEIRDKPVLGGTSQVIRLGPGQ